MIQTRLTNAYGATRLAHAFVGSISSPDVAPFVATVLPEADLIVDGQKLSDIAQLMAVLESANWTSVNGGTVSVSAPEITRITGVDAVVSSLDEQQEQGDDLQVVFTVSDTTGASQTVTISYTVYPVATVATVGDLVLDPVLDDGVAVIPFADLFEPTSPSENWAVPSYITLVYDGRGRFCTVEITYNVTAP